MDHYQKMRQECQQSLSVGAFPVPVSLILVAIQYAMRKSWKKKDRIDIKAAVLRIWDEVIVPADLPIVDGAVEVAVEQSVRALLVALLDASLGDGDE